MAACCKCHTPHPDAALVSVLTVYQTAVLLPSMGAGGVIFLLLPAFLIQTEKHPLFLSFRDHLPSERQECL